MPTMLEKLGYQVGDRFEVQPPCVVCAPGSIVEITKDDGSVIPPVKIISGQKFFDLCFIDVTRHKHIGNATSSASGQARHHSLLEACLGTAIGFLIALCAQLLIFPLFGITAALETNLYIAGIMTGVSIIRSYFIRRFFNYLHLKGVLK